MNQIKKAFKRVKEDNLFLLQRIENLEEQLKSQKREFLEAFELLQEKIELERVSKELLSQNLKNNKKPQKKITTKYKGNNDSKLLHTMTCPIGKRISDKHTTYFKSITQAHEEGYTLCDCLKED